MAGLPVARPRSQRGLGALSVALLLLFASSLALFYLNRGLIFEQKASANHLRSTAAFEVAEAGIEWATGMLNTPQAIDADCQPAGSGGESFRRRYIQTGFPTDSAVAVASNSFPGCKIDGIALRCSCPSPTAGEQVAALGSASLPGFTVAFGSVTDPSTGATDPRAVRVTSTGCTAQTAPCKPTTTATAATTGSSDAHATISVILKLLPTLHRLPSAALTCGGSCSVDGATAVINTDASTDGRLVHAGGSIAFGAGTTRRTLPGLPADAALVAADASLATRSATDAACAASSVFSAYFGRTLQQHAQPGGDVIWIPACTDATTCGGLVDAAYRAGGRSFYFPDGVSLDGSAPFSVLGDTNDGVHLVSSAPIRIDGPLTINGLVVSNSADPGHLSLGSAAINGAVLACGSASLEGSSTLRYMPSTLSGPGLVPGVMVRVPGSWRDS